MPEDRQRVVNYGDRTFADVPLSSLDPFLPHFAKSWRSYTLMSKAKQNSGTTTMWKNAVELCLQDAKVESKEVLEMVVADAYCRDIPPPDVALLL